MAISKYINLLSTPLSQLDLRKIDLKSTLTFKKYLNISFDIYKTQSALVKHQKVIRGILNRDTPFRIRDLNLSIESFMYILCYTSTIVDTNEKISPHYTRRTSTIDTSFLSIRNVYLEDLLYTFQSTWGGMYGSLAYNLYLLEDNSHYLSISEISRRCIKYFTLPENSLSQWGTNLLIILSDDSPTSDAALYSCQISIFKSLELEQTLISLNFLSSFLPSLIYWYENSNSTSEVIRDIVTACYVNGYSSDNLQDLSFKYVHQEITSNFESLYSELSLIRKRLALTNGLNQEELFINSFVENFDPISNIKDKSYLILQDLFPPGGYNTLLVSIASELLNRAYILSHYSTINYSDKPTSDNSSEVLILMSRINRILYYAGYTLKKSNLNSFNLLGNNLIYLSGYVDNEPRIRDLSK